MRSRRARAAVVALALGSVACHHREGPAQAPLPSPPGEPPPVQTPVGAAPIADAGATATSASGYDPQLRRFEVVAVAESTFTILVGGEQWVRPGTDGVVVDPRRRDALVARFRVISRAADSATALVTGQTTRLLPTHVALVREPVPGVLRRGTFWAGIFIGLALGAAAVLIVRR